jgi:cobalamin biosynthesis protein CobC
VLEHGGGIRAAAKLTGLPVHQWLDLSTGINPCGWPVPDVPAALWQRLPESDDGLETAAAGYYSCASLLPVAGTQAAIQALPQMRRPGRVAILHPTYAEHAHAWTRAGHQVFPISGEAVLDGPAKLACDVLVLVNPNNPTGRLFPPELLLAWRQQLAKQGGWLVVDEAYMDATPEFGLAAHCPLPGLIVLRSLGKFFGLAGARVGFTLAAAEVLEPLRERLGPWTLAGPSRWIAARALADRPWQEQARVRLKHEGERLGRSLQAAGLAPAGGCRLFQWCPTPEAGNLKDRLSRLGILARAFSEPTALRFGLPGDEASWFRLETALEQATGRNVRQ